MTTEFKIGSHCLGLAQKHFEQKFADVKPGALQAAMMEIAMEGFRIGYEGKTELYEALELLLQTAQQFEKQASQGTGGRRGGPVFTKARAALAKARGEQS